MFSPSNFDQVCVQATHIEPAGGNVSFSSKKEFAPPDSIKKGKKAATVKKEEGEKPTCSHCQKKGHAEEKCWKLHPELKPKWFKKDQKGKQKSTTVVQDLGSDSSDEATISTMGLKGKSFVNSTIDVSYASTSKSHVVPEDGKRCELFHIRVIRKNTKIDTLIDSRSQVNLISEEDVKQLGLESKPHKRPYPLG